MEEFPLKTLAAQHTTKKARGWIDSLNEDLFVHLSILYENKKGKKAA